MQYPIAARNCFRKFALDNETLKGATTVERSNYFNNLYKLSRKLETQTQLNEWQDKMCMSHSVCKMCI